MCLQHHPENVTAAAATREMKTSRIRRGIIHVTVLSQQTILFYTMALICAWGVISQVVLRSMYGNLLRDVRRQGMAKGKFMKQLRQRYQNVCRMKQNTVNAFNTEAFYTQKSAGVPSFWRIFAYLETDGTDGCHIMCGTGSGRMVYQPAAGGWRHASDLSDRHFADGGNFSSGLWRSGYRICKTVIGDYFAGRAG